MTVPDATPEVLLQEAVALIRERAVAASPSGEGYAGGWNGYALGEGDGRAEMFCGPVVNGYRTGVVFSFAEDCEDCERPSSADVAHIASWHPAVALAVADWLEQVAWLMEHGDVGRRMVDGAVDVARTYLGRQS